MLITIHMSAEQGKPHFETMKLAHVGSPARGKRPERAFLVERSRVCPLS